MESTYQAAGWYYESNGERKGPVDEASLLQLLRMGIIGRETLVWRNGFVGWTPLSASGLMEEEVPLGPPPVSGENVNNTLVWWLAFMPILGSIVEYVIASALGVGSQSMWFITLGLNILLSYMDEKKLKAAGYPTKQLGATWLIPVYLYRRAKMLKQSPAYFIVWIVTFIFMLIA